MTARNLALDKTKHFMAGVLIAFAFGYLISLLTDPLSGALSGFCAATIAGVLKEAVWDTWLGRGISDKHDLYATMAGGALGALVLWGFFYGLENYA